MPYSTTRELPDSVKSSLPERAQEIYQNAFNSAWNQYKNPEDRRKNTSREETAHRVAWSVVKEKYEKIDGDWRKRDE